MAIKVKDGYECGYCNKFYTNPVDADKCKDGHQLIYISMSQQDLNRLIMFIYTKEDELIDDKLLSRLKQYLKGSLVYGT